MDEIKTDTPKRYLFKRWLVLCQDREGFTLEHEFKDETVALNAYEALRKLPGWRLKLHEIHIEEGFHIEEDFEEDSDATFPPPAQDGPAPVVKESLTTAPTDKYDPCDFCCEGEDVGDDMLCRCACHSDPAEAPQADGGGE